MKLLVTGANGFLASRFLEFYQKKYEITGYGHLELDITDSETVARVLETEQPDVVLHCAAVSDLPTCEAKPEWTWGINVEGSKNVAAACRKAGARLILCSSDQVYSRNGVQTPHVETEKLCPPSQYGKQKQCAELLAMEENEDTVCLRLSMLYAADYQGKREHANLLKNIIEALRAGQGISYPIHDYRSITNVWDVVKNLETVFSIPVGIYNFGSENPYSTYEVVEKLLEQCGGKKHLSENKEAFAEEPRNLRMSVEKLKREGIILPGTLEGLIQVFRKNNLTFP